MTTRLKFNKYKETNPIETIITIRELLSKVDIIPIESSWIECNHIFMVNLIIPDSGIQVYGKGSDYYYALSDAYMELIKGLQNFTFFKNNKGLYNHATNEKNAFFTWAPDEKDINTNKCNQREEHWIENLNRYRFQFTKQEHLKMDNSILLPFVDLSSNNITHIPENVLTPVGICTGNTRDEALVSGLCNIIEKYVYHKITKDQITPPQFPKEYIQRFPWINTLIHKIRKETNKQIILMDCSLGEGYPVVGVMILDMQNHQCHLSLACHPIFEVAAERSIISLISKAFISEVSFKENPQESYSKVYQQKHLLFDKPSYSYKIFPLEEASSNKRLYNYLTNILKLKSYDLLLRDVSFLGFPSFHIIVPELSLLYKKDTQLYNQYMYYRKLLSLGEIQSLLKLLLEDTNHLLKSIEDVFQIDIKSVPWYIESIGINMVIHLLEKNYYRDATTLLQKMIPLLKYHKEKSRYDCLLDGIYLKQQNITNQDVDKILCNIYPARIAKEIVQVFNNTSRMLINCYQCKKCTYRTICSYPYKKYIYNKLKKNYAKNPIGQLSLTYHTY